MKRDMDLVRRILLAIEAEPADPDAESEDPATGIDADEFRVSEHVRLVIEAGLVEGHVLSSIGGEAAPSHLQRLTWAGHDYLDAVRSDSVWRKVKESAAKHGLELTLDLAKALAIHYARDLLGLPPG